MILIIIDLRNKLKPKIMKQKLLFLLIMTVNTIFTQSIYEVPVSLPSYDSSNPEMMLITSNSDWAQINNASKKYFYVTPGDYTGLGAITLTRDGTSNSKRYIMLYNGNNTHPGKLPMNTSNLARVQLYLNGADYWVIDRMACWNKTAGSFKPILLRNAKNNVINRFFSHDVGDGISLRTGCDGNTIQKSRIERDNINMYHDRPACGMINENLPNIRITNTHFIDNEVYNYVDGFQTVLWGNSSANRTNVYYDGTIVDNNHFYIDSLVYTNGNGPASQNSNGTRALAENAIDLKVGSSTSSNKIIISNNKMWGYKKSDQTGGQLSDPGAAIVVHFGVKNVLIKDNVIFNSDVGMSLSGVLAPSPYSMHNSTITDNIIYNTKGAALGVYSCRNVLIKNNLIKKAGENSSRWMTGGREWSAASTVTNVENSYFKLKNNFIVLCANKASSAMAFSNSPTVLNNKYYNARPNQTIAHSSDSIFPLSGSDPTANYCDLIFVTDNYTNSPRNITVPKVLASGNCNPEPCTPSANTQNKNECGVNYVWPFNGQSYTSSGVYPYLTENNLGCPHTEILNLTLAPCTSQNVFLEAECADVIGSQWTVVSNSSASGSSQLVANYGSWNQSGVVSGRVKYTFSVPTAGTYYLNVRLETPNGGDSFYFKVNGNQSWIEWHTQAVYNALTWQRKQGISAVYLNAGVNTLEIALREGHLVIDKLALMKTTASISGAGENANNCTPQPCVPTSGSQNVSRCGSYTWPENGVTYSSSGVYSFQSTNSEGCNHVETLNLTITNSRTITETITSCDSYLWTRNNETYTTSGVRQFTYTNNAGCQITRKLNLTIKESSSSTVDVSRCGSYTWPVDGVTYNASGSYPYLSVNSDGCNHVTTLNLTITTCTSQNVFLEAECADVIGSQWTVVSNSSASGSSQLVANYGLWHQSGVVSGRVKYTFNVPTAGTYYLNARLETPSGGDSFYFRINGAQSWIEWHTQAVYNALTWQRKQGVSTVYLNAGVNTLEIALREGYLVIDKLALMKTIASVSGAGESSSNCSTQQSLLQLTDIKSKEKLNLLKVYPNPFKDEVKVEFENNMIINSIEVLNLNGQVVLSNNSYNEGVLNLRSLKPGIYFIKVTSEELTVINRIIKQ